MAGKHITLLLVASLLGVIPLRQAAAIPPSAADFKAAAELGSEVASWLISLSLTAETKDGGPVVPPLGKPVVEDWREAREKSIESVALVALEEHNPVDPALSNVIENEMMESIRRLGVSKVSTCYECRTPAVYIQDNEIIVTKGIADVDAIKRAAKKLNVDVLLVSEVFRTKFTIVTQVAAYNVATGELMGSEKFEADSLISEQDTVQLLLTFGTGAPMIANDTSFGTEEGGLTGSANIQLSEEIGFAKGGLNLGLVMADGNTLIHLAPTLGFRGSVGNSTLQWMLNLGAGYGIQGAFRGFAARGSLELILGSWAVLGADSVFFFPDGEDTDTYLSGYVGFHIGVSIGR